MSRIAAIVPTAVPRRAETRARACPAAEMKRPRSLNYPGPSVGREPPRNLVLVEPGHLNIPTVDVVFLRLDDRACCGYSVGYSKNFRADLTLEPASRHLSRWPTIAERCGSAETPGDAHLLKIVESRVHRRPRSASSLSALPLRHFSLEIHCVHASLADLAQSPSTRSSRCGRFKRTLERQHLTPSRRLSCDCPMSFAGPALEDPPSIV